jgi:hypothetical protein
VHDKLWQASNVVARKAKESSVYLVDFSSRRTVIVVVWAKDNVIRIYF